MASTHIRLPKTKLRPKSSARARRLIRAAFELTKTRATPNGSLRRAAQLIGLPNHGQLYKMLSGKIADTPAMRAALRKPFLGRAADHDPVNVEAVCQIIHEIESRLETLRELCAPSSREGRGL